MALTLLTFTQTSFAAAGDINAGKTKSATCAACHGADGNTQVGNWPKLAGLTATYITNQLQAFKKGAQGKRPHDVMTGIASGLSDQDMADLAAYFASLPRQTSAAQPTNLALGKQLYRAGDRKKQIPACSACHGPRGEGNAEANFPALTGQNPDYTIAQLKSFQTGKRTNDYNHIMQDIANNMKDADMQAVANYIAGLH